MDALERYRRACVRADKAIAAERAALIRARDEGCTLQQLADVRGRTRSGVLYLLRRGSKPGDAPCQS